ncbi:MAG: hypothetical protein HY881_02920 [Deltaproteobacteria bacterium]|nr:hypothetical protein [Deltaproteobacteria bacterium]
MKNIFIENDISSFADFHDTEWFAGLFDAVDGSGLEAPTDELASHWWGASRSFVLPWLYVNGIYDSIDNTVSIIEKSRQDLWNEFLEVNSFKVSLWKIAEGSFCAIYYAYENFLVRILSEITGKHLRVTDRDFNKELIRTYGQVLANRFWTTNFISVSREIRNCITHNGGKVTKRLLNMKPLPMIENGDVLISASIIRLGFCMRVFARVPLGMGWIRSHKSCVA